MEFEEKQSSTIYARWIRDEFAYISLKREYGESNVEEEQRIRRELQIPEFNGRNCHDWIKEMEDIFYFFQLNKVEKMKVIIMSLVGEALWWFTEEQQRRPSCEWPELKLLFVMRFGSKTALRLTQQTPARVGNKVKQQVDLKITNSGPNFFSVTGCCLTGSLDSGEIMEKSGREDCNKARVLGRSVGFKHQRWWKPQIVLEKEKSMVQQESVRKLECGGHGGLMDPYVGPEVGTGCGSGGGPGNSARNGRYEVRRGDLEGGHGCLTENGDSGGGEFGGGGKSGGGGCLEEEENRSKRGGCAREDEIKVEGGSSGGGPGVVAESCLTDVASDLVYGSNNGVGQRKIPEVEWSKRSLTEVDSLHKKQIFEGASKGSTGNVFLRHIVAATALGDSSWDLGKTSGNSNEGKSVMGLTYSKPNSSMKLFGLTGFRPNCSYQTPTSNYFILQLPYSLNSSSIKPTHPFKHDPPDIFLEPIPLKPNSISTSIYTTPPTLNLNIPRTQFGAHKLTQHNTHSSKPTFGFTHSHSHSQTQFLIPQSTIQTNPLLHHRHTLPPQEYGVQSNSRECSANYFPP